MRAVAFDGLLQLFEVCKLRDLEAHVVEAVARCVLEHDRVVVVLVPALQVHPLGLAGHLDQPHHLRVVRGGELQVRDPDFDVGEPEDAHRLPARSASS
jgi:hypothetical protein